MERNQLIRTILNNSIDEFTEVYNIDLHNSSYVSAHIVKEYMKLSLESSLIERLVAVVMKNFLLVKNEEDKNYIGIGDTDRVIFQYFQELYIKKLESLLSV